MDALALELARARSRSMVATSSSSTSVIQRSIDGRKVFVRSAATLAASATTQTMPASSIEPQAKAQPVNIPESLQAPLPSATTLPPSISSTTVNARLRNRNVPITYFGETDGTRRQRLFELEGDSTVLLLIPPVSQQPIPASKRQREDDGDAHAVDDTRPVVSLLAREKVAPTVDHQSELEREVDDEDDEEEGVEEASASGGLVSPDTRDVVFTTHLAAQVYAPAGTTGDAHLYLFHFWRGILSEWASELAMRPAAVSSTAAGIAESTAHATAKEAMRPFFRLCRARALPPVICDLCVEIVNHIFARDYMTAGDAYLRLAVGKGQWVIGVSQVGIHERASRERLYLGKIAHVMNDESQRRYITNLKRLMTWVQVKYPPTDPSRAFRP